MDEATFASLSAYLEQLDKLQRSGVRPRSVTIGIAIPPDNAATARRYAGRLRDALAILLGGRPVHGRTVAVELLEGDAAAILASAQKDVVAVVGLAPSARLDVAAFTDRQVPVLFPLFPLAGSEDKTIVRGLMADRQDALRAISDRFASDRVKTVIVIDEPGCGGAADGFIKRYGVTGIGYALSTPPLTRDAQHNGTRHVLLLCQDQRKAKEVLQALPADAKIYGLASELLSPMQGSRHHLVLALPEIFLVSRKGDGNIVDVHAVAAARLLVSALKVAGRGLDRTRLVASIGAVPDAELPLDFAADALNGTRFVTFIETKPR
ncbi:hypothetical protein [Shinella sp. BYT-45]|uniref:hypothetical protein n=1 Tax=Shinella sp. BYT-45 TaxID=3377377 RepID=UPI00398032DB